MDNLFSHTSQVCFELSNMCNRACHSSKCPLIFYGKVGGEGKVVLPSYVIGKTLNELAACGYKGHICFNIYNEPMMDIRLMRFIWMVKEKLGDDGKPFVITNGTLLNQQLIDEMCEAGLSVLWISCYADALQEEVNNYIYPDQLIVSVKRMELTEIGDTYTRSFVDSTVPCLAPLSIMVVRCDGTVHLCCRDYKTSVSFGNLCDESLIDILKKGEMQKLYDELSQGKRTLDICRRCNTAF